MQLRDSNPIYVSLNKADLNEAAYAADAFGVYR